MCGIAGIYDQRRVGDPQLEATAEIMAKTLVHRGPDSGGVWTDPAAGVALGHRRLAIRDLTPAGHQPMLSSCGRFVIAYNGEIYSQTEIASDLRVQGRVLKGESDTEVILEACALWGVEHTVERLIGMFAFSLYDKASKELVLVRDRLGIKPLYWGKFGPLFLFGSELKALRAVDGWEPALNRDALSAFMRHNYIPAPYSIYKDVYKLEPGSILRLKEDGTHSVKKFWDMKEVVKYRSVTKQLISDGDAIEQLDELVTDSVCRRMVSDVPLGALLSGGIDSSIVAAIMAERSSRPVNTFSIGFEDPAFNEAPYAAEIARHLGTDHTELYAEASHALGMVEKLPHWFDEPFADSSQLPTALVCELTKQHVTVVLSGDGGDELFAGYNRYTLGFEAWRKANVAPYAIRKALSRGLLNRSEKSLDRLNRLIPRSWRRGQLGNKLHKFAHAILLEDPDVMYRQMLSHWSDPDDLVLGAQEPKGVLWDPEVKKLVPHFLDRMQYLDTLTYLPDDILTKVDRTSMIVALEARVPLLDHRLVEFAWSLPRRMKIRGGESKWALRQILYKRVPRSLIDRPKMGFGVPIDQWLRGPLRDWAESLLDETFLRKQGVFCPEPIRARWEAHLAGQNWAYPIWNVLMAQAWLRENKGVRL